MNFRTVTLVFAIITMSSAGYAQDDQRTINEFVDTWITAANAEDLEAFLELVTDDAVIMVPEAPALIGKPSIGDAYRGYYEIYDVEYSVSVQELEVMDEVAYVWAIVQGSRTVKDTREQQAATYNNIWILRRQPDGWKFWRVIFNSAAPPERR